MTQKIPPTGLSNNRPFRNKIINGDFNIFQRSTSAVTAGNNTYTTADRWKTQIATDGAMTTEQESLSLADQATTGSQKAWEIKCTSTDSSIASNQYALFLQSIEAQFLQDFLYGTSSAKTLTCSFWVKSSLTGTYGFFVVKGDTTSYYLPIEFTIDSANTWEKKVIEISPTAGSTSLITSSAGVIDNDNGIGMDIGICLAMGGSYQGTNNTWTTSAHYTTSNQVNFLSNTSNNFYITSFQLEVGNDATEFEVLPFDVQERRCFRYFQTLHMTTNSIKVGGVTGTAVAQVDFEYPNGEMRTSPTITLPSVGSSSGTTAFLTLNGSYPSTIGTHSVSTTTEIHTRVTCTGYTGAFTLGHSSIFYSNGTNTFKMDAEL